MSVINTCALGSLHFFFYFIIFIIFSLHLLFHNYYFLFCVYFIYYYFLILSKCALFCVFPQSLAFEVSKACKIMLIVFCIARAFTWLFASYQCSFSFTKHINVVCLISLPSKEIQVLSPLFRFLWKYHCTDNIRFIGMFPLQVAYNFLFCASPQNKQKLVFLVVFLLLLLQSELQPHNHSSSLMACHL